jgi:multidrug efflux pump subunit AcrA (membrane-fusion protein)
MPENALRSSYAELPNGNKGSCRRDTPIRIVTFPKTPCDRAMKTTTAKLMVFGVVVVLACVVTSRPGEPQVSWSKIPDVLAVQAGTYCFADRIVAIGHLVPNEEAVVLPPSGYHATEILVEEGATVVDNQPLARLIRSEGAHGPIRPGEANTILRAPAAGVITSTARTGAPASSFASMDPEREPLFRLLIGGKIDAEVEVPSIHLPKLRTGANQRARVKMGDRTELSGRVRLVPGEVDPKTQLGRVRLEIEQNSSLRVGMFVRAAIDANHSCGVSVPRSSVIYQSESASVELIVKNVIMRKRVIPGLTSDFEIEIKSGVSENDILIANAGTYLREGDQVKFHLRK